MSLVPPKSAAISRKMRLIRLIIFMYVDLSHHRLYSDTDWPVGFRMQVDGEQAAPTIDL